MNSEKLYIFDHSRPEFKPYGLTVEKWTPEIMPRPDRHNEIEINLLTEGSLTYLINDQKITFPAETLIVFWALVPHQIIHFENEAPYYVCTIPLNQFMDWQLPSTFVDHILKGRIVLGTPDDENAHDRFLMENWLRDVSSGDVKRVDVSVLEIVARLNRLALNAHPAKGNVTKAGEYDYMMTDLVERIVIYVARHYKNPIKNSDIGRAVGLHPDYANTIFKKSFGMTLNQYVVLQRILHVQRKLSVTNESITELAFQAGFNSLSRFNAAFRVKCGCSPREYRKKYRTG